MKDDMIKIVMSLEAEEAKKTLVALVDRMKDMTPVMRTIGQTIRASVQKNFETGGRPGTWIGLSPATLRKRRGKGERRILVDTARLKNSINVRAGGPSHVTVGTNVIYAAIHHFGGMAGRGRKVKIAARPYMLIQEED